MVGSWLVACEYSATVRDALRDRGIDAYSCDLLATEGDPKWHIQDDAVKVAYGHKWAGMIAHPVCTRMANSALRDAPIPLKAIENSVMHAHAIALTRRGPTQFVHPHYFGSPFFKLTGLELIGLPRLRRTHHMDLPKPGTDEHKRWSKVHRMTPSEDRAKERARFDPAIAAAMGDQWGSSRTIFGPLFEAAA